LGGEVLKEDDMMELQSQSYENPWEYEAGGGGAPLILITFTVTDSSTLYPIPGASCVLYAGLDGSGDAASGLTDGQGKVIVDASWFAPHSWSVSRDGYQTIISNEVGSEINVELVAISGQYTVRIYSSAGGTTDPTGSITWVPNTDLTVTAIPSSGYEFDYWTYKGQNLGSTNPMVFLIDQDSITITAVFKLGPTPPPNGEPWPIQIQVPFTGRLAPGLLLEEQDSTPIKNVDLVTVLGGRVDYALRYESGKIPGITLYIYWNNELMSQEAFGFSGIGQTRTGSFDLGLDKIRTTNTLTVMMSQGPLGYNVCSFDCPTVLGFSTEPAEPPSGEDWWDGVMEWLKIYGPWVALGAGVIIVGGVLLSRKPVYIVKHPHITYEAQIGGRT